MPTRRRTPPGPRVRRRGDRPLPHRAHVHGRGAAADRARDDPRRATRTSAAPRSTGCCRCSRPTSRASSRRWRGCRSRSGCSTRRCTSSCPRSRRRPTPRCASGSGAAGVEPDARHARLPPRPPVPGDLRDAGAGDRPRRERRRRAHRARRRWSRSCTRSSASPRSCARLRVLTETVAAEEAEVAYLVGTMIELPRACIRADEIAELRRLLLLRHERPDADRARLLPRRRRGQVPHLLPGARRARAEPVRDARPRAASAT